VDLSDPSSSITLVCALAMIIGVFGVVVPMLPGLLLCWASVLAWAVLAADGGGRWVALGIATVVAAAGITLKYLWPGRNLKRSEVPNRSLLAGGVLGAIGFFLIPVIGLPIGFVVGIWAAERMRLGTFEAAWPSTKHALKAAGLAMLIELGAAGTIAATWVVALVVT
jgi:uncharacterized protein